VAAGNTDGDLAMLQWTAASPYRTLELVVHHTDGDREYAYDRDPILGSGTGQILAAAAEHKWTVIDMAADWATIQDLSAFPFTVKADLRENYPFGMLAVPQRDVQPDVGIDEVFGDLSALG